MSHFSKEIKDMVSTFSLTPIARLALPTYPIHDAPGFITRTYADPAEIYEKHSVTNGPKVCAMSRTNGDFVNRGLLHEPILHDK